VDPQVILKGKKKMKRKHYFEFNHPFNPCRKCFTRSDVLFSYLKCHALRFE